MHYGNTSDLINEQIKWWWWWWWWWVCLPTRVQ